MSYVTTNINDYISRETKALTKALFMGSNTPLFSRTIANVKGSTSVPHLGGSATWQKGTCVTPTGSTPITEVVLTVQPLVWAEPVCQGDLQSVLENTVLMPGSNAEGDAPKAFEETFVDSKISDLAVETENHYWQGDTAGSTFTKFNGFLKAIDAGTAIDGNTSLATSITKANVIGLVDDMIVATPSDVLLGDRAVIFVGIDTYQKYIAALKTANLYHFDPRQSSKFQYRIEESNISLVGVRGLNGTNRMVSGDGANFIIGSDLPEDETFMKIAYDVVSDTTIYRVKAKIGTAVANIDEIVEFTLTV